MNVANNHIAQHGLASLSHTLRILKDNNISYIGIDAEDKTVPFFFEKDGLTVIFVGYSLHSEHYFRGKPPYSQRKSGKEVIKEVEKLKAKFGKPLIVSLHWGEEFVRFPSKVQVDLAHALVDSGVGRYFRSSSTRSSRD